MLYKEKQHLALLSDYAKVKDIMSNPGKGYDYFALLLLLYYKFGYGLLSLDSENVFLFSSGKRISFLKTEYIAKLKSLDQSLLLGNIINETNIVCSDVSFAEHCKSLGISENFINKTNANIYVDDFKRVYGAYLFLNNLEKAKLKKSLKEIKNEYSKYNKEGKETLLEAIFDPIYSLLLLPHIDNKVAASSISYLNLCLEIFGEDFEKYLKDQKEGVNDQINYYVNSLIDESHAGSYKKFVDSYNALKFVPKETPKTSTKASSKHVEKSSKPADFSTYVAPTLKPKPAPAVRRAPASHPAPSPRHASASRPVRTSYKHRSSFKLIMLMLLLIVISAGLAVGYYCLFKLGTPRAYEFFMHRPFRFMNYPNWAEVYFNFIGVGFDSFWHLLHYIVAGFIGIIIFAIQTIIFFVVLFLSCVLWLLEKAFGLLQYPIAVLLPYASIFGAFSLCVHINDEHFRDIRAGFLTAHVAVTGIICCGIFLAECVLIWIW